MKLSICMVKADTQRHLLNFKRSLLGTQIRYEALALHGKSWHPEASFERVWSDSKDFSENRCSRIGSGPWSGATLFGGPSIKTEYNRPKQLKTSRKKKRRKNIGKSLKNIEIRSFLNVKTQKLLKNCHFKWLFRIVILRFLVFRPATIFTKNNSNIWEAQFILVPQADHLL